MSVLDVICWSIACHFIGDYVLQSDFIANTKGSNWYHLLVHSILYCIPFAILFKYVGLPNVWFSISILLITHFIIDAGKARYKACSYVEDQLFHFFVIWLILIAENWNGICTSWI